MIRLRVLVTYSILAHKDSGTLCPICSAVLQCGEMLLRVDVLYDLQVKDVTVEVATVDHTLQRLCTRYNGRSRARRMSRIRTQLPRKSWAPLWNLQNLTILITVVVFVVVVIVWSLLWVFICELTYMETQTQCLSHMYTQTF